MSTRIMVGAFLTCQNKVLLMNRNNDRKIAPGLWSCIGGHLEREEVSDPRQINHIAAIYREIKEEAGISRDEILNLGLRYITMRIVRDEGENEEIRPCYYYVGKASREFKPPYCGEGILHWVELKDTVNLPMSFSVKEVVKHWLDNSATKKDTVFLVGINKDNNQSTFIEL